MPPISCTRSAVRYSTLNRHPPKTGSEPQLLVVFHSRSIKYMYIKSISTSVANKLLIAIQLDFI
jgi:hypothetical protein